MCNKRIYVFPHYYHACLLPFFPPSYPSFHFLVCMPVSVSQYSLLFFFYVSPLTLLFVILLSCLITSFFAFPLLLDPCFCFHMAEALLSVVLLPFAVEVNLEEKHMNFVLPVFPSLLLWSFA